MTPLNWEGLKNLPNSPAAGGVDDAIYQELVVIYSAIREIEEQVKLQQIVINELIGAAQNG